MWVNRRKCVIYVTHRKGATYIAQTEFMCYIAKSPMTRFDNYCVRKNKMTSRLSVNLANRLEIMTMLQMIYWKAMSLIWKFHELNVLMLRFLMTKYFDIPKWKHGILRRKIKWKPQILIDGQLNKIWSRSR